MTFQDSLNISRGDCSGTCRVKTYPDGSVELLACTEPVFRAEGWERAGWKKPTKKASPNGDKTARKSNESSTERAMRRARAQVRDLALCTPFRYFVTLTLDQFKVDRYDMAAITRKLNNWLDNQVRRRGLAYVLVPERHKDGAIHFHGFFNDALEVVDSGHKDCKGHVVYNLPGWTLGFTTAIALYGSYHQAVSYVCKYIGKQGEKIGGRWYYSGGAVGRPQVEHADIEYREVMALEGAVTFTPEGSGLGFALARFAPEHEEGFYEMGRTGKEPPGGPGWGRGEAGMDGGARPPGPGPEGPGGV